MSLKENRQAADLVEESNKRWKGKKDGRGTVNECQTAQAGRQSGRVGGL